jgi:hypothetical protein
MNNKKTALVVGCSYANGHGLLAGSDIWPTMLMQSIDISDIDNLSESGVNNHWIFLETSTALLKKNYDVVVVAWSETNRFNINFGLELYKTASRLVDEFDINLNSGQTVTGQYQSDIGNKLRRHLNDHWGILDLIKYVNILKKLKPENLFFVNSLGTWSPDFFQKKIFCKPSELSTFEKNLLEIDNRDDDQIMQLYNMIHDQYQHYHGIQPLSWLNLYNSLNDMKVDNASSTDLHPGTNSQHFFAKALLPELLHRLK